MGFANTLLVKVTRCASNCSLHNLVASLYDSVLLSVMRLVMHRTIWRLADTGRAVASVACALPDPSPIPNTAIPHAAALIHPHYSYRSPIAPAQPQFNIQSGVWRAAGPDQGADIGEFCGVGLTGTY